MKTTVTHLLQKARRSARCAAIAFNTCFLVAIVSVTSESLLFVAGSFAVLLAVTQWRLAVENELEREQQIKNTPDNGKQDMCKVRTGTQRF